MTVDILSCGHCPRDDFDSFDELRKHVEDCADDGGERAREAPPLAADGGPQTRECPDCGLVTERTDLVLTEDGHHVCPGCGSIIQTYSALRKPGPHVLVTATEQKSSAAAHLPSEENPLVPRCPDTNRIPDANYKPVLNSRLSSKFSLCKRCDPEYEIESENTGEQLSAKLRKLEIDEEDDLIADGCGVLNISEESYTLDGGLQMAEDAQDLAVEGDLDRASRLAAEASSQFTDAANGGGD